MRFGSFFSVLSGNDKNTKKIIPQKEKQHIKRDRDGGDETELIYKMNESVTKE